jgi:SAM-dependent methyltransferase
LAAVGIGFSPPVLRTSGLKAIPSTLKPASPAWLAADRIGFSRPVLRTSGLKAIPSTLKLASPAWLAADVVGLDAPVLRGRAEGNPSAALRTGRQWSLRLAFGFASVAMNDSSRRTRETYDAVAVRFLENARDRTGFAPWLDRFAADLSPGALAVDLGAGPGMDTANLRARGVRAVGLDFSMGMLRAGIDQYPGPRVQGDARRLPFSDGSVDGVWANASLLHLDEADARRALAEVWRILRPGAALYLSVKAGTGAEEETERYGRPRFFQYWSVDALDATLVGAGFEVTDRHADVTPRATWLARLARRRP